RRPWGRLLGFVPPQSDVSANVRDRRGLAAVDVALPFKCAAVRSRTGGAQPQRRELRMTIEHRSRRLNPRTHLAPFFLSTALLVACSSRVPARVETVNGHQVEIATAG